MGDISNKAEEFTGRAKEAVGDLTGDDELRTEGAADKAGAQVKQGVEAVAGKAQEAAEDVKNAVSETVDDAAAQLSDARDKAADAARQLPADNAGVIIAVIAGLAVVVAIAVRRNRRASRSNTKHPVAKKVAAAGITRALTR